MANLDDKGRRILILTDGKAGHENQSRAFARSLGCVCDVAEVHFKSAGGKALTYLLDHLGVLSPGFLKLTKSVDGSPRNETLSAERFRSAGYAAVVGTGSGTFYAAKALARALGVKCGVVLYPRGYRIATFDCILAPAFDRPAKAANVIEIPANLVAADAAFYAAGVEKFTAHHLQTTGRPPAEGPVVAVIVGGPNKCSTMSAEWMKAQLDAVFAAAPDCAFWVTTSRRTPSEVEAVVDGYPWAYKLLYSKDHFNPIPAFVSRAKTLYVTAESTGMLSEACTTGAAEVRVLDNLKPGPHKFRRFVEDLRKGGYVDGNRKVDLSEQFARAGALMGMK